MQITYLIGNGFDKQIGLDTDYNSFYENYCKESDADSDLIKSLKNSIKPSTLEKIVGHDLTNPINWADLEEGLGQYTTHLKEIGECEELFFDINSNLKTYLKEQELRLTTVSDKDKIKIKDDFSNPIKYFRDNDIARLAGMPKSSPISVDIITFNYTNTIETLLDYDGKVSSLNVIFGMGIQSFNIHHIHNSLKDSILILGVNDESQIANDTLRDDAILQTLMVKPKENDLVALSRNRAYENIFNVTSLFVLFGLSLGMTDNKWWTLLKNKLLDGSTVLLYIREDNEPVNLYFYNKLVEKKKDEFLEKLGIDLLNKCRENILVCFNHQLFQINKLPDVTKFAKVYSR